MSNILTFDGVTHSYYLDGQRLPGCSEILKEIGLSDYSFVRQDVMDAASKFGDAAHMACTLNDNCTLDNETLSDPLIPYLQDWQKFLSDYEPVILTDWIEKRTFSLRWKFGVTPDRVMVIKNKVCVVEIKTTTSIMPAVALQLAAQKIAVEENYGKVHRRIAVQLTGEGYKIHEFKKPTDEETFICARKVYSWKKENL